MDSIEVKAASVEEAVNQGLKELGTTKEQVEIEVLSKGGLFSKAAVRLTVKETHAARAVSFVKTLFEKMRIDCEVAGAETEDEVQLEISGEGSRSAIGYRGETLDAIQYLSLLVANQNSVKFKKVVINAENYRAKREETLTSLADKLARKAVRTGRKIRLEPMNPFERRVIHTALADSPYATTESEGEEPNRRVVIYPKRQARTGEGGGYGYQNRRGYGDKPRYNRDNRQGDNRQGSYNRGGYGRSYENRYENKYESENRYKEFEEDLDYQPKGNYDEQPKESPEKKKAPVRFKSFGK